MIHMILRQPRIVFFDGTETDNTFLVAYFFTADKIVEILKQEKILTPQALREFDIIRCLKAEKLEELDKHRFLLMDIGLVEEKKKIMGNFSDWADPLSEMALLMVAEKLEEAKEVIYEVLEPYRPSNVSKDWSPAGEDGTLLLIRQLQMLRAGGTLAFTDGVSLTLDHIPHLDKLGKGNPIPQVTMKVGSVKTNYQVLKALAFLGFDLILDGVQP